MSTPLREPPGTAAPETDRPWRIAAEGRAATKGWARTIRADPRAAARAYAYLRDHPFQRYPGRCFPLRGKVNEGVWQYEVNATYRLRYALSMNEDRTVLVLYAGDYH